jgi:hypothetical protein
MFNFAIGKMMLYFFNFTGSQSISKSELLGVVLQIDSARHDCLPFDIHSSFSLIDPLYDTLRNTAMTSKQQRVLTIENKVN